MKLDRQFKPWITTFLALQIAFSEPARAKQDESNYLKELVVQAMTIKSLERTSLQLRNVRGDEAAQRTRLIGEQLVALYGKPIRIRIARGKNVPISLEIGEIVIPEYGMDGYTNGEINFILAHELAHIEMKHGSAEIRLAAHGCPAFDGDTATYIRQLGSCIAENHDDKGNFLPIMRELRWQHEHEADIWAIRFLSQHKLPADYRTVLKKTAYARDTNGTNTHPPVHQRLEVIERMIAN